MEYEHAISGMLRKRDEIAQRIEGLRVEASRLTNDMRAIERALHAMGVAGVPQPPMAYHYNFERHELRRFILSYFRHHETATTRAVTAAICAEKNIDPDDRKTVKEIREAVTRGFIHLADRGLAERSGSKQAYVWRLTAPSPTESRRI